MELKTQLEDAIAGLYADPRIEVIGPERQASDVLQSNYTHEALDKLEAKVGSALPDELRSLLLEVGTFTLGWRTWAEPDIWGKLSFKPFFFKGELKISDGLYYLPEKGHFAVSAKMAKPDSTSARQSSRKLTESFAEAFGIMLRARGAHGWAQAYFGRWTGENREAQRHDPRPGLVQAALPVLFDDFNLEDFGKAAEVAPVSDLGSLDQHAFDLSEENAGLTFATRLQRQIEIVDQNAKWRFFDVAFNPPATQEEIDWVEETMGFELSERFLNYFRSCNGFQFSAVQISYSKAEDEFSDGELRELWQEYREGGGTHCSVKLPALRDIFTATAMPPMDGHEDIRFFAYIDDPLPDGHASKTWNMLALDLELGTTNPIVRMASDYGADTSSRAPVEACTYFEWLLQTLGNYGDHERLFKAVGGPVAGPVRRATPQELDAFSHNDDVFFDDNILRADYWDK